MKSANNELVYSQWCSSKAKNYRSYAINTLTIFVKTLKLKGNCTFHQVRSF